MDRGRAARGMRWAGVGGTGLDVSRVGWIVPLLKRDLWAAKMGPADFVSLHLATFLQCSAVDCQWVHRAGRLRCLLLAELGDSLRRTHSGFADPWSRVASGQLDCDARNGARDIHLPFHGFSALPAHHRDWAP